MLLQTVALDSLVFGIDWLEVYGSFVDEQLGRATLYSLKKMLYRLMVKVEFSFISGGISGRVSIRS